MNRNLVIGLFLISLLIAPVARASSGTTSAPQENQPADSTVAEAVSLICKASDQMHSKAGKVTGCRVCPTGTDFRAEKEIHWELNTAISGHFTSAHEDNLLLSGSGCDSHAANFGGTFVFGEKEGKVRLIRYAQGLIASQCHNFVYPEGRNFLICLGGWGGQGENDENVFTASFNPSGREEITYLLSTSDTTGTCNEDDSQTVQESRIKGIEFEPRPSGAITGVTVTATLGTIPCSQRSKTSTKGNPSSPTKTYSVRFLFDGKRFNADTKSRSAYLLFEQK